MPTEIAGVVVIALIIGLVEVAKRLGMDNRWAPLFAMAIGVLVFLGNQVAGVYPWFAPFYQTLLWGIVAGLTAVGLYSTVKNTAPKPPDAGPDENPS